MPQLMARRVLQPGPLAGAGQDLIQGKVLISAWPGPRRQSRPCPGSGYRQDLDA